MTNTSTVPGSGPDVLRGREGLNRDRRDAGQIIPLVLGYALILLLVVVVVVDAATVFLQRRALAALADGTAVAAASAVDPAAIAAGGLDTHQALVLSADRSTAAAASYLATAPAAQRFDDLRLLGVQLSTDATMLTVRVQARVMLPFIGRLAVEHADGVLVEADASARSPLVPLPP